MACLLAIAETDTKAIISLLYIATMNTFGQHRFFGAEAERYLIAQGLHRLVLQTTGWTQDADKADKVANAVLMWAKYRKATSFCHWFQPLGAAGMRYGQSAQVQHALWTVDDNGSAKWKFDGKMLLQGEADGSSFFHGELRHTHAAAAYTVLDPSSSIFLRGDCIFIPACLCSYEGAALDEKTPLLRSIDALSTQGARLLNLLDLPIDGITPNIGLEQEFFLVPQAAYQTRPDLQLTGRTLFGAAPPKGQDACDHYMAPLAPNVLACMQEVQKECALLGIPLRTRHREVAPGQYEFAPLFGPTTQQVDQNVMVMQLLDEIAPRHGLAALLHEKPFHGVNGSGKHNNWSLAVQNEEHTNLFNYPQLRAKFGEAGEAAFPVVMAAMVQAVSQHGDLLRASVAAPGNDFRLGACEAPPAIMTTCLGEDLTAYLGAYAQGTAEAAYEPATKQVALGASGLPLLTVPAEDRNRTSPFPYGGHRFEFRAVGSSQNVSLVNVVLNTITADAFASFADAIEGGMTPKAVAQTSLTTHWDAIFNGDGYDAENQKMLTKRNVCRIDSPVEAIYQLASPKNEAMFGAFGVFSTAELRARTDVQLRHYAEAVRIEANVMISLVRKHVDVHVRDAVSHLVIASKQIEQQSDARNAAMHAFMVRNKQMERLRQKVDAIEAIAHQWPLASYKDLMLT
jgi:glutamine synthetase